MDCLRTFTKAIHRCSNIFSPNWVILYFITQVVNPMTNPISCIGHPAFNIISLFISRISNLLIAKIFSYWILSHSNSKVTPWVHRLCDGTSELGNEVHIEPKNLLLYTLKVDFYFYYSFLTHSCQIVCANTFWWRIPIPVRWGRRILDFESWTEKIFFSIFQNSFLFLNLDIINSEGSSPSQGDSEM